MPYIELGYKYKFLWKFPLEDVDNSKRLIYVYSFYIYFIYLCGFVSVSVILDRLIVVYFDTDLYCNQCRIY